LAAALTRALTSRPGFAPAQPARDTLESIDSWVSLVEQVEPALRHEGRSARAVAVVATEAKGGESAQRLAQTTQSVETELVEAESRTGALFRTRAEWVVFLDDDDNPDDGLLAALVAAQAASGADVVTVAVRPRGARDGVHLFLGDPGALGLVENQYGVVG